MGGSACVPKLRMEPTVWKAVAGAIRGSGVDLLVGVNNRLTSLRFANPVAQIGDKLFQSSDLGLGGGVAVEVTDEADTQGDVVEVIARHVTPVDLALPSVAYLDLPVAGAVSVTDHEVVGEAVLHVPDTLVVDVEDPGVSLARAAVVDHDVFPAAFTDGSPVDGRTGGGTQIGIASVRSEDPAPEAFGGRRGCRLRNRLKPLISLDARFLDGDRRRGGGTVWERQRRGGGVMHR